MRFSVCVITVEMAGQTLLLWLSCVDCSCVAPLGFQKEYHTVYLLSLVATIIIIFTSAKSNIGILFLFNVC